MTVLVLAFLALVLAAVAAADAAGRLRRRDESRRALPPASGAPASSRPAGLPEALERTHVGATLHAARLPGGSRFAAAGLGAGALVVAGVGGLATGVLPFGLVLGAAALVGAWQLVRRRARAREHAFVEQLDEAVSVMARALRAGQPLEVALEEAASHLPEPTRGELGRVLADLRLGLPFGVAVRALARRFPRQRDVGFLAASLVLQHRTGGALGDMLERLAGTLRERRAFRGALRAATAEARATGTVLGALPVAFAGLMVLARPEYVSLLFEHPTGRSLLGLAVGLEIAGLVVLRRLARVEAA